VQRLLAVQGFADRVNLDLGAVRDFDYYSGVIFEVFAPGLGAPLAAGGRYDGLLQRFGEPWPATGLVVFLDRVQAILDGNGSGPAVPRTLVGYASDPAPALVLAAQLRSAGENVVVEVEARDETTLVERARLLAVARVLFCDSEGSWELGPTGRVPVGESP
jgi:ATP phosphoribosyltransferase regulatory subunit